MNMRLISASILVSVTLLLACQQNIERAECKKPKSLNPNGDSELALLMRDMFTESDSLRQLVANGQQLSGLRKYQEIHAAIPTDSTVKGPVFDAFAVAYIEAIRNLETQDSSTVFNFNRMVDQCMNCHTEFCPGPKKRIQKLYIQS